MRHWILMAFCGALVAIFAIQLSTRASARSATARQEVPTQGDASPGVRDGGVPLDVAADGGPVVAAESTTSRTAAGLFAGLDLAHLHVEEGQMVATMSGNRRARLFLRPALQRSAERVLTHFQIPEACVVLMEPRTGHVLTWASHVEKGDTRDVCAEATAPSASVFKIVTAAELVEHQGLRADTVQCYSGGGESRITATDLLDDPKRDRYCPTLAEAMGRSLNVVFAKLALRYSNRAAIASMAESFGFGSPIPFELKVTPSTVDIPEDRLGFARTAAGFWNTTLSPLQAVSLAATVANRGEAPRPTLVESISSGATVLYQAPGRDVGRRTLRPDTAQELTAMMETTVVSGTSHHAFHDEAGTPFLPAISVAGKTGTLTRSQTDQFYTWFVGFAPSRTPEIAISVLVVNEPKWRVKANVVAREVLRAYFAEKGAKGVTRPSAR